MNNYIYIIILTFILASTHFENNNNNNKYPEVNSDVNNHTGEIRESKRLPETKEVQDQELTPGETADREVESGISAIEEINREVSKESNEDLSCFVGEKFDPGYHPPYAASGYVMEHIIIDKIEDGKVSGYYSSIAGFIGNSCVFNDVSINDDNSIIILNTWDGKDPQTEEKLPEAYTKTKIIFDRVIDGNPIIKTVELGPVEGSGTILEEYYYNSKPGTIHEWFSNNYMYYDLNMSDEEMVDWITKNITTPWQ